MERKNIDWASLGFNYVQTDYRYVSNYKDGAWDAGCLTDQATVTMSECACVLQSQDLGLTQSGLSYHMKILCESGLVESRQESKWTHYRLSESGRQRALALLEQLTAPNGEAGECGCKK